MYNISPFQSPFGTPFQTVPALHAEPTPRSPQPPREAGLPRMIQYVADYSGCGFWRMLWPEHVINAHQKGISHSTSVMILQPEYYTGCKAIRIQRQATPAQLQFVKWLKNEIQPRYGTKLIYEIDDIVFREDIPDYNKFKFAFESDEIRSSILEMMNLCDEITVTCPFMRDYYREKTGKREVTIIPNFFPKFWIGNYYSDKRVSELYNKNKKKPRILYAGSGAHFDVDNKVKGRDDFEHVLQTIIKTRKKFQWVFLGAFPPPLTPYVQNGEIEFHPWQRMYEYPQKIYELGVQAMVAPLQDNNFNRSKSDLKYIEACAYGLPIACQNMCTYENAEYKFDTPGEMIDQLDDALKHGPSYREKSKKRYRVAESRFLEKDENIDCYLELINTPYGSPERKLLSKWNKDL